MFKLHKIFGFFFFFITLPFVVYPQDKEVYRVQYERYKKVSDRLFNSSDFTFIYGFFKKDSTHIDTLIFNHKRKSLDLIFDHSLQQMPLRKNIWTTMNQELKNATLPRYKNYDLHLFSNKKELSKQLIPNYFLSEKEQDPSRIIHHFERKNLPVVSPLSVPYKEKLTLYNKGIALWHSHGWYYEKELDRWEWQRPRLFKTVEDLLPMTFVINYLLPMLENAGASVFLPRERSIQTHEVVVDNDDSESNFFIHHTSYEVLQKGFAKTTEFLKEENPFYQGTSLKVKSKNDTQTLFSYVPNIPETGYYPVYVSYQSLKKSATKVMYEIHHTGGVSKFSVNQQIGGGTWIYLGTFKFWKGTDADNGSVIVKNNVCKKGKIITTDAVRFGGGMGNISRNGQISQRARYQEGARYYLQYAGFPDSLVWKLNKETNDYKDDLNAHGEWVNYLSGNYYKKRKKQQPKGLGIPIDLALAFHTDAGKTEADSIIGTLAIYNTKEDKGLLPNKMPKILSRDLCDIVQTQIVNDLRKKYTPKWTRRALKDGRYSEAFRPNTPTMLLELLSHQNFYDMQFAHYPDFQFDVSRAIYKGIVKFLSNMQKFEYQIQPLPVTKFSSEITNKQTLLLRWEAQTDPLEPIAEAEKFIVYTKKNNSGYDNGKLVKTNTFELENPEKNVIYSFKVSAINKGGESFPSEELSACITDNTNNKVLIINAFDRLGGASYFEEQKLAGYLPLDEGVAYKYDFYTVGEQYDFNKKSPWLDDDAPGFGASYADKETQIKAGNTFDFPLLHGQAIQNANYSFASASNEAVEQNPDLLDNYFATDLIMGEQKTSYFPNNDSIKHYEVFTEKLLSTLNQFTKKGGNIFISGAYIGSDALTNKKDSVVAELLKFKIKTDNACKKGTFHFTDTTLNVKFGQYQFNTKHHKKIYKAECVDAIEPADKEAKTFIRYSENNKSAGVIFSKNYKVIAMGFPFETILNEEHRNKLMKEILIFFDKTEKNE